MKEQSDISVWESARVLKSSVVYQVLVGKRNVYIYLLGKGKINHGIFEICVSIIIATKAYPFP